LCYDNLLRILEVRATTKLHKVYSEEAVIVPGKPLLSWETFNANLPDPRFWIQQLDSASRGPKDLKLIPRM
jgi:hypothetical protein